MKTILIILFTCFITLILVAPFSFLKPEKIVKEVVNTQQVASKHKAKPEQPLHNVILPNFASIVDVKEKKRQFFGFLKPAVKQANLDILANRKKLLHIEAKFGMEEEIFDSELMFLKALTRLYKIKNADTPFQQITALLTRVDKVPLELVLIQAANESAWGTSRFARIGLNFFGLWCYKKGCGLVPNARNNNAKHEVAAFQSVDSAVKAYLHNINTHYAYEMFRSIRGQLRSQEQPLLPEVLATGLIPYSERGAEYVVDLLNMLRHNKRYFVAETLPVSAI
jgi:Bax protein